MTDLPIVAISAIEHFVYSRVIHGELEKQLYLGASRV